MSNSAVLATEENEKACVCLKDNPSENFTTSDIHFLIRQPTADPDPYKMCSTEKTECEKFRSFLAEYESPVYSSLLGTALIYNNLVVLEDHNIIMRRDYRSMRGKVKLLAGGGAGLEPGEVGCIGQGMLTAAVFGEVMVAPSANSILIAIRELAHEHEDGVLLLVKNYPGDRLNFGLALERAASENIYVKLVLIGDDSSESDPGPNGRRGMAGCIVLYKLVGAMAEAGKSLEEIFEVCQKSSLTDMYTVNMCLSVSGHLEWAQGEQDEREEALLGIGAYGQPGMKIKYTGLADVVSKMISTMTDPTSLTSISPNGESYVVLLNNMGGMSKLDEALVCAEVIKTLINSKFTITRFYSGTFMTLLESKGFSITLLRVNSPEVLRFIDMPTTAFNWPASSITEIGPDSSGVAFSSLSPVVKPTFDHDELDRKKFEGKSFGPAVSEKEKAVIQNILVFASEALISCEKSINVIDLEVGDGDAGTMLKKGAEAVKKALEEGQINLDYPFKMLNDLSSIVDKNVGGITGALYSIFFARGSHAFLGAEEVTRETWCEALKHGVKGIMYYVQHPPGRSLLDVLRVAVPVFEQANREKEEIYRTASTIASKCEYHAEETLKKKPTQMRGKRPKELIIYPDAGAHAAAIWIRAVCEGVKLKYPDV